MKQQVAGFLLTLLITLQATLSHAFQQADSVKIPPHDWFLRDPQQDSVQGVSAERAYSTLLRDRSSKPVLVAVIDSGIDIDHEDLKDVIWVNEDEIPGNGEDDDNNGYIDDIHGWNFIGGKNGNVNEDTYEVTREYARLLPKYENAEKRKIRKKDKAEYEYWKKVKAKYERDFQVNKDQYEQFRQQYEMYINAYRTMAFCDSVLERVSGKPVLKSTLGDIEERSDTVAFAKQTLTKILESVDGDIYVKDFLAELDAYLDYMKEGFDHYRIAVEYGYNPAFNSRDIVGDDPNNLYERGYGNNDVEGPDPKHGTHVAGIIAANRKNTIGVKGIAGNVRIMSLRAVPNGDERDKDIANAIMYAADNGAQIINMSFGKKFSPQKEVVDRAVRYAESKGVLLMHAAGNDGDNIDQDPNFPNRSYSAGGQSRNWMEIGAISSKADEEFVASFSNYGRKSVDLFAPGVQIYSTTPESTYENLQGTSMACPAAAGVAALLMSYFPELSARDVKAILSLSTRKYDALIVNKPGSNEHVPFKELSATGGVIDAYQAVRLALNWNLPN